MEGIKIFLEITLCFFSCVGIINLFFDVWKHVNKNKKIVAATVVILSDENEKNLLYQLLEFSHYYHTTYGEKYIEKIIVLGASEQLLSNKSLIKDILNIPIEFSSEYSMPIIRKDKRNDRDEKHR